jgi:hypothetical protein
MTAARVLATIGVACVCVGQSPAPQAGLPLSGDQILARAKAVFRAYPRPGFIAYTLVRRDQHNGQPDFENSYTLKIWCRTADRSALARHAWKGAAYGGLENITVMFDRAVDPGPPTADMFEKRFFGATSARREDPSGATAQPRASGASTTDPQSTSAPLPLPEIGRVEARDGDYHVWRVAREGELIHLWLEARSDPDRNRLDEIWVDAQRYDLRRAKVRDHLYLFGGQSLEDDFDVRFTPGAGGLPIIASIHGQTKYAQFETDYTYRDVSFPASLPDWYFDPKTYGVHKTDAPR